MNGTKPTLSLSPSLSVLTLLKNVYLINLQGPFLLDCRSMFFFSNRPKGVKENYSSHIYFDPFVLFCCFFMYLSKLFLNLSQLVKEETPELSQSCIPNSFPIRGGKRLIKSFCPSKQQKELALNPQVLHCTCLAQLEAIVCLIERVVVCTRSRS